METAEGNTGYWSYSRITTYLSCSLSYFFRYISDEEPASVSSNLILGSAVHYGHELLYRGMKHGTIPALSDILDEVAEDILIRKKLNPPIVYPKSGGDIDGLIEEAQRLTECLYNSAKPEKIVAVDLEENVPLIDNGATLPKPLKVIYDLIVAGDGAEIVVDLKTAKCRFGQQKIQWDLQPTCYLYARGISGGVHVRRSFRYDVLLKNKTPLFIQYPTSRDRDDYQRLISIIKVVDRGINSGVFIPNRSSFFCSTCEWGQLCQDWKG